MTQEKQEPGPLPDESDILWDRAGKYVNLLESCETGGDRVSLMCHILRESRTPPAKSEDEGDDEATIIRWQERLHAITDAVGVDGDGSDGDELDYTAAAVQKAINKLQDEIEELQVICCGDDDHANCPEVKKKLAEMKSDEEVRAEVWEEAAEIVGWHSDPQLCFSNRAKALRSKPKETKP